MAAILAALFTAHAAPGQSGVLFPSAAPPEHTLRVGIGGGGAWMLDDVAAGLTVLDVAVRPVEGLQIAGMASLQTNGRFRQDPAFVAVTGTLPWRSNVKLAASAAFATLDGRHHGALGVLLGNHSGKVRWDLGVYPLVLDYTPDWGWQEIDDGDRSPRWDLRPEYRVVTAGIDAGMSKHWRVRVGYPDGLTFSFDKGHFWLDAGGVTLYHLGGFLYLKSGVKW